MKSGFCIPKLGSLYQLWVRVFDVLGTLHNNVTVFVAPALQQLTSYWCKWLWNGPRRIRRSLVRVRRRDGPEHLDLVAVACVYDEYGLSEIAESQCSLNRAVVRNTSRPCASRRENHRPLTTKSVYKCRMQTKETCDKWSCCMIRKRQITHSGTRGASRILEAT